MKRTGFKRKQTNLKRGKLNKTSKHKVGAKKALDKWYLAVKARDGYVCQFPGCGKSKAEGYVIQAHHICGKGAAPHMKYDMDNGISLCYEHHKGTMGIHSLHPEDAKQALINLVGRGKYDELYLRSKHTLKVKRDFASLCDYFDSIIKRVMEVEQP